MFYQFFESYIINISLNESKVNYFLDGLQVYLVYFIKGQFYDFVDGLQVYLVYMIMNEIELFCRRFTGLPGLLG